MKRYHNKKLILSGLISFMLVILALIFFTQQSTNTSETILFTCVIVFAVVMFLYSFTEGKDMTVLSLN